MAGRRKSTIGASPLDAVVPRGGDGEGRSRASRSDASSGDGIPVEGARIPKAPQERRMGRKERLTVHVPAELSDRAKNAVYWTPGLTLARLAERALTAEVEMLEAERGGSFPERAEELRGGRPVK